MPVFMYASYKKEMGLVIAQYYSSLSEIYSMNMDANLSN
jgi:hypothetical protein